MKNKRLVFVCESAVMIALSTVLSMIKLFQMPLGGAVTPVSMLPVMLISIKYGVKNGLPIAFIYSAVQILLSLGELMAWGMTVKIWIGCIIFDYIIAFTALGISGIFSNKSRLKITAGISLACLIRLISHIISGVVFFAEWCPPQWQNRILLYSICYNGAFLLPELIITLIAAALLFGNKAFAKILNLV